MQFCYVLVYIYQENLNYLYPMQMQTNQFFDFYNIGQFYHNLFHQTLSLFFDQIELYPKGFLFFLLENFLCKQFLNPSFEI